MCAGWAVAASAAGAATDSATAAAAPAGGSASTEAQREAFSAAAYSNSALVYDSDYPFLHYSARATHNDVARLEAEMASGKLKLQYQPPRGYLDSLLKALKISPTSQVMVFSKTSLQSTIIGPTTPRAIYFNDDDYVAWIDHTPMIEINVMDSALGPVFYTMEEIPDQPAKFERQTLLCLSCHDTFSLQGGGVPNFLFLSAYRIQGNMVDTDTVAQKTDNSTPMVDRWGGWYVTGKFGGMLDLGNIIPSSSGAPIPLSSVSRANVPSLDRFFDPKAYPTDKSDVVAILVLQNQIGVHNLIIHANYKSRWLLEQQKRGSSTENLSWQDLSPSMQERFAVLLEPLVRGMLFLDAAKLPAPVQGNSGYEHWFQSLGPFDSHGRSLRDFDLRTRIFKYPLSFLIYSKGFDYLIPSVRQYVYARLYQILTGEDHRPDFARLTPKDRKAVLEILEATKPAFARVAREAERTGHTVLSAGTAGADQPAKTASRRSGPKPTSRISAGATIAHTRNSAKA